MKIFRKRRAIQDPTKLKEISIVICLFAFLSLIGQFFSNPLNSVWIFSAAGVFYFWSKHNAELVTKYKFKTF